MISTISTLPTSPNRNDPTTFSDRADALLGAMPTLVTELNNFVSEVNTLSFKTPCRAATRTNITLSGSPQTLDGISVSAGDRVLVKDQNNSAENGVYIVGGGSWVRAADMDTPAEVAGSFVPITFGALQGGKIYYTTFNATGGVVGTTAIPWNSLTDGTITGVGTIAVANGGTGLSSYSIGDLVYASAATTLTKLNAAANGNVLKSGTAPSWGKVDLTTDVTGTLPAASLPAASTSTSGIVQLATEAEIVAGTLSTTKAITPAVLRSGALYRSSVITIGALAGYTWSTIPSWVKRITVIMNGCSTSTTTNTGVQIQLGTTGSGIISSGYNSHLVGINQGTGQYKLTTGFLVTPIGMLDSAVFHGTMVIHIDNTLGVAIATGQNMYTVNDGAVQFSSGILAYATTIDRIRISTTNGSTFDIGNVTFIFE